MKEENKNTDPALNKSNKTGRERKYDVMRAGDLEKLEQAIDKYFTVCFGSPELTDAKDFKVPPTTLGLALALGVSKAVMYDMVKENNSLSILLKKALDVIQNWTELQLFTNPRQIGVLFSLKNNYNWKDKTEIDTNLTGNIIVKFSDEDEQLPPDNTPESEENI